MNDLCNDEQKSTSVNNDCELALCFNINNNVDDYENNKRRKKNEEQQNMEAGHGRDISIRINTNNNVNGYVQNNNYNTNDNVDEPNQYNNINNNNNIYNDYDQNNYAKLSFSVSDNTTDDYDSAYSDDSHDDIMVTWII